MDRSVRILMINYEFPPLGGGSGNATLSFLREVAGHPEITVDLLTSGTDSREAPERLFRNVSIHRIRISKAQPYLWTTREVVEWVARAVGRSRDLVKDHRYHLCHCWSGWPSGWIGYLHRGRMPYIVALRGSDVPGYNPRLRVLDPLLLQPISRFIWKGASAVTCVSSNLREMARRTMPGLTCDIIPNGVDAERFLPGTVPERFTILFVGRLIERKSVIDLLEAFRNVTWEYGGCSLQLVGGGPQQGRLEAFCREAGIEDRVAFLGPIDGPSIAQVYRNASVFVIPALEEAMSNAALEAMASGLPVITTRTGVSEVIDGNGVLVDRRRPDQIAEALRRYMRDPDLRDQHGRRSREIAERRTWFEVARAYLEVYSNVLCEHRGQAYSEGLIR